MNILILHKDDILVHRLAYLIRHQEKVQSVFLHQVVPSDFANFDKIIVSVGAVTTTEMQQLSDFVQKNVTQKSILCIGTAACVLAQKWGATLQNLTLPNYAATRSAIWAGGTTNLTQSIPREQEVAIYGNSAIIKLSNDLVFTAKDKQNSILAWRHRKYNVEGLTFHPASLLTQSGERLVQNWING